MSDTAASRPKLTHTRSLPSQHQVRGFASPDTSELSSGDEDRFEPAIGNDWVSAVARDDDDDDDDEEREDAGEDQYPAPSILKIPAFFSSSSLHLANAHDEAERQARQQQMQNYEAVMKRFQVRRVAVRAFSTSNVSSSSQRSIHNSAHSVITQGRREFEASAMLGEHEPGADHQQQLQQQTSEQASFAPAPPAASVRSGMSSRSLGRNSSPSQTAMQRRAKANAYAHSYPPEPQRVTRFTLHRFVVKKRRRMLRRLRRLRESLCSVIYPTSTFQRVREGVLFNVFVLQLVFLPLLPVYFPHESVLIVALQFTAEWIYFLDCALSFNTAFFKKTTNELVTSRKAIARHYLCGWFVLDMLSSVPVNTFVYFSSGGKGLYDLSPLTYLFLDNVARIPRFVSFFRMLQALRSAARALRAGQNFWTWALLYSRYSHLLRIARLVFVVLLLEHYMACFWQYLSPIAAAAESADVASSPPLELYLRNFYNAVLLVHGQSVPTASVAQTVYSTFAVFMGSFVLAIVFGNVAMLVSNFNASATNYQRNMEKVFATMKKMHLPSELQDRIRQYFTHLWQEYDAVDADLVKFPKELTPTLALEVGLCKYMNLITGVPFWRDCSPDFVSQIIRNLVVRVYLPDDFVLRQREISQDLFMINRGTCELTHPAAEQTPEGSQAAADLRVLSSKYTSRKTSSATTALKPVVSPSSHKKNAKFHHSVREADTPASSYSPELLHPGEVFGGMGLLLNFEQQFNVRAVTHVEMCVLGRHEFQTLLRRFQHDRSIVLTALLEDVILKNELPFSMKEVFGVSVVDEEDEDGEPTNDVPVSDNVDSSRSAVPKKLDAAGERDASQSTTSMSALEAARFLMKKINHLVVDPSIKFGFQQVDLPSPTQFAAPQDTAAPSDGAGSAAREQIDPTRAASPPPPLGSDRTGSSSRVQVAATELPEEAQPPQSQGQRTESLPPDPSEPLSTMPRGSSTRRRRSSHPVAVGAEHLAHMQAEMQVLEQRVSDIEGSQVSVLNALEALQQFIERINQNVSALASRSVASDRVESRGLRQQRSMHKILSLPANWEEGAQATLPQHLVEVASDTRELMQSSARPGFRLRVGRAYPRSQTGLYGRELVTPAQPDSSRTKSYVLPAPRRASMFPRRMAVVANRPSLSKKRELLADSLWTQYPSPK